MRGLTVEEEQLLLRSVGTHRKERKLSPLEVAQLLQSAMDNGATRKECAERLQIGTSQVSAFLSLLNVSPEIQHLADWSNLSPSTIPFSSLAQLASLAQPSDQVRAAEAILAHRLSWKEVVQLVQVKNRSSQPIEDCIKAVLRLRPEIETRHIFVGSIIFEQLKGELSRLPQSERDQLLERAMRKVFGTREGFVGRLGPERVTIVGPADPAQLMGLSPDALESRLNELMMEDTVVR